MRILVTGAAGFIGSALSLRLLERGDEVVGIDCLNDYYDVNIKKARLARTTAYDRFTDLRIHLEDREAMAETFARHQPQRVVNLAAQAGVRYSLENPRAYTDSNVVGFINILEGCRNHKVDHLVYASTSSVYGANTSMPFSVHDNVDHPLSLYAATKKAGELLCHTATHLHGFSCMCLRFFTVYGPRQRPDLAIRKFATLMTRGEEVPMFGDGSTERDYTYIDDILQGIMGALGYARSNPGSYEVVNLGESRTISLREMIDTVADVFGVVPNVVQHPLQPGDVMRTYADVSRARRLFGYDPTTDFRTGVERFAEWFHGTMSHAGR